MECEVVNVVSSGTMMSVVVPGPHESAVVVGSFVVQVIVMLELVVVAVTALAVGATLSTVQL